MEALIEQPDWLKPNFDNIPQELRRYNQWVMWRGVLKADKNGQTKWTKEPYHPRGFLASSTDAKTWSGFATCTGAYEMGGYDGIGFVVTDNDPFVAIDLDHCCAFSEKQVDPWATEIVRSVASYAEASPSGTGIRILAKGKLPPKDRRKGDVEMYETGRYVTITGRNLGRYDLAERQEQIATTHEKYVARPERTLSVVPPVSSITTLEEDQIVAMVERHPKYGALWRGSTIGYGSQSEADLAFCNRLAFLSHNDSALIDRIFRRSGLMRAKWDEKRGTYSYGELTVETAMEGRVEFYNPRAPEPDYKFVTGEIAELDKDELVQMVASLTQQLYDEKQAHEVTKEQLGQREKHVKWTHELMSTRNVNSTYLRAMYFLRWGYEWRGEVGRVDKDGYRDLYLPELSELSGIPVATLRRYINMAASDKMGWIDKKTVYAVEDGKVQKATVRIKARETFLTHPKMMEPAEKVTLSQFIRCPSCNKTQVKATRYRCLNPSCNHEWDDESIDQEAKAAVEQKVVKRAERKKRIANIGSFMATMKPVDDYEFVTDPDETDLPDADSGVVTNMHDTITVVTSYPSQTIPAPPPNRPKAPYTARVGI